jgi:predicted nucleic-acid-binding protein
VSQLVLAETLWVLDSVYDLWRSQIATAVEMLLNHSELSLQDADVVAAALAHYRRRSNSRTVSCWRLQERPVTCRLLHSTASLPN